MALHLDPSVESHIDRYVRDAVGAFARGECTSDVLIYAMRAAITTAAADLPLFWTLILNGQRIAVQDDIMTRVGEPLREDDEARDERALARRTVLRLVDRTNS